MDELLLQAMEPVLRDLRSAAIALPLVEDTNWTQEPGTPSAFLRSPDGTGSGVYVVRSKPAWERVAFVADLVQEWAIEQLWGRAPTNWPSCPHHGTTHPLKATTHNKAAVWVCPVDGSLVANIGAL